MSNIEKIMKFVIPFFIMLVFFISLLVFVYMNSYNKSEVNKHYTQGLTSLSVNMEELCLNAVEQPFGGLVFYSKLFPFNFTLILLSVFLILVVYVYIFLKIFINDKKKSLIFAAFTMLIFFVPMLYFFAFSIMLILASFILAILIFIRLKISYYDKYMLAIYTFFVFSSYILFFGAWINTEHSIYYDCMRYIN